MRGERRPGLPGGLSRTTFNLPVLVDTRPSGALGARDPTLRGARARGTAWIHTPHLARLNQVHQVWKIVVLNHTGHDPLRRSGVQWRPDDIHVGDDRGLSRYLGDPRFQRR